MAPSYESAAANPLTLIGLVTYLGDSITNHSSIRHSASPTFALMVELIN